MFREFPAKDGVMYIGGKSAVEIADEFGTPVYVTDEQRVRENYRRIYGAFSRFMDTRVHYACKANTNLAILSILREEGAGIDAVSIGEVRSCLKAGFTPDRIMYTGVNVSDAELKAVSELGVMINLAWTQGVIYNPRTIMYLLAPTIMICLLILSLVWIGKALEDVFDPSLRK